MSDKNEMEASANFLALVWNSLVAPDRLFRFIREQSSRMWIGAAILWLMIGILPAFAAQRQVGEQIGAISTSVEEGRSENIPPGADVEAIEGSIGIIRVFAFIGPFLSMVFNWVAWSGALFAMASVLGGQVTFGRLWRLSIWSYLPLAIQGILTSSYLLLTGGTTPITFSLAAFMTNPFPQFDSSLPPEQAAAAATMPSPLEGALYGFASWIDLFIIWRLLLLILGLALIARLSYKKSAAVVVGLWLLVVLLAVLPSIFLNQMF